MYKVSKKEKRIFGTGLTALLLTTFAALVISGCNPHNCENLSDEFRNLEETTQYMYVLWRPAGESMDDFQVRLFENIAPALLSSGPQHLVVMFAKPEIESISIIEVPRDDGALVSALISATVENETEAIALADIINPEVAFVAGYEVTKAVPLDYDKDWADGTPSPGIQSVTFLRQRVGMEYEDFKDYWFCSHTPFALDIHPLWRYERNVVEKAITQDAPDYDGIVELHLIQENDLTDLDRFFGGNFLVNGLRINNDVNNFIDMDTIEVTAMTEHILKSNDDE